MLKINHIDVFHGTFQALWDISIEVREGEMLALIGANTSGKTTLLDTISGVLHPARGTIEFEGITQVPEGRCIFPEMTVFENLIIGSYCGSARKKREENLKKVFEHFPKLQERQRQIAKTLSGGEQQMLAIGRGLMSDPKLMLIDEMSLGLAPIVIDEIFKAIRSIKERGITILFVEQNVKRTLQEADRAYILENGRVALSGTTDELKEEEKVKKAYFGVEVCST